jgi:hypothetical protein
MKRVVVSTFFVLVSFSVWSQIEITNTETPEQLVLNTFMGNNLSISNIKFNGSTASAQNWRDQIGKYSNGTASLNSEEGLILATGNVSAALGPNNTGSKSFPTLIPIFGDADLAMISGATVNAVCKLEFDFIPNGDTVLFEYIFASEEYPEFVNSSFNDTFGLFLSGPGISGPYTNNAINIAVIPGTSHAVSINNLNNGNANLGPCENCQYYISNGVGTTPEINSEIQYDARSSIFTALGAVTPGETYHLKFVIANIGTDNQFDSAMFLTQGSLRSATLHTQNFERDSVKIFPNPATDFIQVSNADSIVEVNIYDLQGRDVINSKVESTDIKIDTSGLQVGIYVVEFMSINHEITRQRLVIK